MSDQENGRPPARSWLAVALVKGGLAFGAVWMLTILGLAARIAFELL